MQSKPPTPEPPSPRERQRLETRERVYEAAIDEIGRSRLASADIGAIVARAGVARGTFYFHFPTREHVLLELEQREEVRMVAALERRGAERSDLRGLFEEVVREVRRTERRIGSGLLRDMLSVHFGVPPDGGDIGAHPLAVRIVEAVETAAATGDLRPGVDAVHVATIFLTGLFGILATSSGPGKDRDALVDSLVDTVVRGVETS